MKTKVIEPKLLFYKEGTTSLKKLNDYSKTTVEDLLEEAKKAGIEPKGPMEFIYYGATDDVDKEFTLQVGLPVSDKKPCSKSFNFKETSPFKCVSYQYKGDVSKMFDVYSDLFNEIHQKQFKPKDEVREVYINWEHLTSENNLTEIQIGIN